MLSLEAYRVAIGVFYLRLKHRIHIRQCRERNSRKSCSSSCRSCSNVLPRNFIPSLWQIKIPFLICSATLVFFLNLHYSKVMAENLTQEGVESNPGPRNFAIKKSVQASHHQGDSRYQIESAGKQCTANAYLAIVLSAIKNVNIWKSFDLDYVLEQGDRIFNDVCRVKGIYQSLAVDELPLNIVLEGVHVSATRLAHESYLFCEKNNLFENYIHYSSV